VEALPEGADLGRGGERTTERQGRDHHAERDGRVGRRARVDAEQHRRCVVGGLVLELPGRRRDVTGSGLLELGPELGTIGIIASLVPWIPNAEIDPEWILAGVLPPLLYSSAVSMPSLLMSVPIRFSQETWIPDERMYSVCHHWALRTPMPRNSSTT
ncbi:hypothetical protein IAE22_28865, partial [Bacillus sp. S34]|nr:hypothetical protein [Bacillus sp. S34]